MNTNGHRERILPGGACPSVGWLVSDFWGDLKAVPFALGGPLGPIWVPCSSACSNMAEKTFDINENAASKQRFMAGYLKRAARLSVRLRCLR